MSLPLWANTKELKKLFGRAKRLNADADVLSDRDAVEGFLEQADKEEAQIGKIPSFVSLHFLILLLLFVVLCRSTR